MYTGTDGSRTEALVVKVHRDDPSAPYYTVKVGAETVEKQTDGKRLEKVCAFGCISHTYTHSPHAPLGSVPLLSRFTAMTLGPLLHCENGRGDSGEADEREAS